MNYVQQICIWVHPAALFEWASQIGGLFFETSSSDVHFGAVSLIHSALKRNAATHHKVLTPFSFSHVRSPNFDALGKFEEHYSRT